MPGTRRRCRRRSSGTPPSARGRRRSRTSASPSRWTTTMTSLGARWRWWMLATAAVLLAGPAFALAADGVSVKDVTIALDFTDQNGALAQYLARSLSTAWHWVPFSMVVGFVVEGIGPTPGTPRNFQAVAWRTLIVCILLANYSAVLGKVIKYSGEIAAELRPTDATQEFSDHLDNLYKNMQQSDADAQDAAIAAGVETDGFGNVATGPDADKALKANQEKVAKDTAEVGKAPAKYGLAGPIYDGMIGFFLTFMKAIVFGVEWVSKILAAVFYIVGPIALAAAIPRFSGTGSKWFHHYVTICSWPIFSGILLGVAVAVAKQGALQEQTSSYLGALVAGLIMGFIALVAPVIASWVVGGAMQ